MIAILSDIHGNLPALESVLTDAESHGCSRFISLGDVAGYGGQVGECIDLLSSVRAVNILGNHDQYMVENLPCPRSRVVSEIIDIQRTTLNPSHLSWLAESSQFIVLDDAMYVHGGPNDPTDEYMYEVSQTSIPRHVTWLFSGHTHVQVLANFGERKYCNPGSVGQPRDGDPRSAYALFDGLDVELRRVAYDIGRAVEAMRLLGFKPEWYENLHAGRQVGGRVDSVKVLPTDGSRG